MQKVSKIRFLFRLILLYTVFSAALKTPVVVQGTGSHNHLQILSHLDKDLRKVNISTESSRTNHGRAFFFATPFSEYCKNLINQRTKGQTSWRVIIVPAVCLPYVWRYNSNSNSSITTTTPITPNRTTCTCEMAFKKTDFMQVPGKTYEEADDFCIPNKCVVDDSQYRTLRRRHGKNNDGMRGDCKCTSLNLVLKNPSISLTETLERSSKGCDCETSCFPKSGTDTGKEKTSDETCVAKVTLTHYENPSGGSQIPPQTKLITKDILCTCSEKREKSRKRHKCECQPNS